MTRDDTHAAAIRLYEVGSRIRSLCEGLKLVSDEGPQCNSGLVLDFADVIQTLASEVSSVGETIEKAGQVTAPPATAATAWLEAIAAYIVARTISEATPDDAPNVDELTDVWCVAMDKLIDLPAPRHADILYKLALIEDRFEGGMIPDDYMAAIKADIRRLGKLGAEA
ncbi:hypothetical protein M9978_16615 [Sphingomonas sp. MG17]|uniref:Uncharacterized protein n=1 Tax=Sphingomonas tagetis TaxID=2949092 RepID=A0A9X2HR32_9SPHN|nr:hypothetical protein [Sphingomonas tagetis]MCP3732049.1 hypothetical protein [Sphingomonas tagetis]